MSGARLTHNAIASFRRARCPSSSLNEAYRRLRRQCETARHSECPPGWLRSPRPDNDGYLLLDGGNVALSLRGGRAVACLVNPSPMPGLAEHARSSRG